CSLSRFVTSFVSDILMPPIGLLLGQVDFSNLFINLSANKYPSVAAAKDAGAPTLNYGLFITNILDFVIVAFPVFLLVRAINRLKSKQPEAPTAAPTTRD